MRRRLLIGALAAALVLSLGWGYYQYRLAGQYRLIVENQNRRAFNDLAAHLDQMETSLAKARVANSGSQQVLYFTQAAGQSDAAGKDFAVLPGDNVGMSYLGQFLTQAGDMLRSFAYRTAAGGTLASGEEKTLADVHGRLLNVNRQVQELLARFDAENLAWTEPAPGLTKRLLTRPSAPAAAEGQENPAKSVRTGLNQLDANLQKLPPFSYTGEFAARTTPEPLGLPKNEVTREQAGIAARDFLMKLGHPAAAPQFAGDTQGDMPGYQWQMQDSYLEVTKRGGLVRLYRNQRPLGLRTIGLTDAKVKGIAALQALGWRDLVLTAAEDFGAYVQLEAVSETKGIRIYPDKVRLTVAMDNGQLIGLDATDYYAFHHLRDLPSPRLTLEGARRRVRPDVRVGENRLAVMPKIGGQEVFCYEFRGTRQGEDYLIYINALNGSEEQIKRVINTPRGEYLQ